MIKIYTDSTSYIPLDIQAENDINVLPLTVIVDGKDYYETEISNEHFYASVRKNNNIPQSKPIEISVIAKAFEKEINAGNTVIAIFLSSKVSETYNNAVKAKRRLLEKYPKANIHIIDSQSACMEEGLAVLAAAEKIRQGGWLEDVINATNNTIKHTRFLFMPDTLKYLEIGGRIKKFQAIFGGLVQMTPIITTKDGEVQLLERVQGRNNAINRALEIFKNDIEKYGIKKVIISHIDALDNAMELAKQVEEIARLEVGISDVGPAIGAHVGPGAVGIVYQTDQPMND